MEVGSLFPLEKQPNGQMAPCQDAATDSLAEDKSFCVIVPGHPLRDIA